jgi:hypothetical protein
LKEIAIYADDYYDEKKVSEIYDDEMESEIYDDEMESEIDSDEYYCGEILMLMASDVSIDCYQMVVNDHIEIFSFLYLLLLIGLFTV